jgi:hypothetical protein
LAGYSEFSNHIAFTLRFFGVNMPLNTSKLTFFESGITSELSYRKDEFLMKIDPNVTEKDLPNLDDTVRENRTVRFTDREWAKMIIMARKKNSSKSKFIRDNTIYKQNFKSGSGGEITFPENIASDFNSIKIGVRFLTRVEREKLKGPLTKKRIKELLEAAAKLPKK